jgi:hypothetical protein
MHDSGRKWDKNRKKLAIVNKNRENSKGNCFQFAENEFCFIIHMKSMTLKYKN